MSVFGYCFEIHVFSQFHIFCVDSEYLEPTDLVWHSNINLSIESAEPAESWVDCVGSIRSSDNDYMSSAFEAVHKSKQLGNDSSLDFSTDFFSVGSDGVEFVDENDSWAVFLSFLESLPQISLSLSRHFGHYFGSIDEEEESSSFVGYSSSYKGLSRARRTIEQNSPGRFDSKCFEKLRMPERKLNHFSNSSHLLPAAPNIVISHIIKSLLFLPVYGLSLGIEHSVGSNDAELFGLRGDNFELDRLEAAADDEEVSLFDGAVGVFEVGDEVGLGDVAGDALNGVPERQDVYFGEVGDVACGFDLHNVAQTHSQVFSDGLVHADFAVVELVIDEGHHQRLFPLLALYEDGVSFENFQLCHLGLAQLH